MQIYRLAKMDQQQFKTKNSIITGIEQIEKCEGSELKVLEMWRFNLELLKYGKMTLCGLCVLQAPWETMASFG